MIVWSPVLVSSLLIVVSPPLAKSKIRAELEITNTAPDVVRVPDELIRVVPAPVLVIIDVPKLIVLSPPKTQSPSVVTAKFSVVNSPSVTIRLLHTSASISVVVVAPAELITKVFAHVLLLLVRLLVPVMFHVEVPASTV